MVKKNSFEDKMKECDLHHEIVLKEIERIFKENTIGCNENEIEKWKTIIYSDNHYCTVNELLKQKSKYAKEKNCEEKNWDVILNKIHNHYLKFEYLSN